MRSSLRDATETLELDEQAERLYAATDRFESVDRMLVTMFLDGRSYHEMAEVIESNAAVKLHHIKRALALLLAAEAV